ncbi:MAG: glycogen synthase GlgA [Blastochloris sp.]|nr:glycogen synthase GlgA [Blastochloris sp.]
MNILFATSELTPYAKTGGLGDVVAALPAAIRGQGHSVSVVIPLYRALKKTLPRLKLSELILTAQLGAFEVTARVWNGVTENGVSVFAIERDEYYDRGNLYGGAGGDYFDNASRFIFFSKMVVELARYVEPRPEIIHVNDWQTALVPALVKQARLPYKTVLTIHNLAYQGLFPYYDFNLTNLPDSWFRVDALEYYGMLNLLKSGILSVDEVTTVSPTYAKEILTEEFGCGLHDALTLRSAQGALTGILNGIDTEVWNPAKDRFIKHGYDRETLKNKKICKKELLQKMGFKKGASKPLVACISRLVEQKGFDLIVEIMPKLLKTGAHFVLLGSGDPVLEKAFLELAKKFPQQVAVRIGFDEDLAHEIEAGADLFLMPSVFEPCGLNQMYSQRYGTIPIVHDIGGLSDSVKAWNGKKKSGTGFKFKGGTSDALWKQVKAALELMGDSEGWEAIRRNAMARDFSWAHVVPRYEDVYEKVLGK